MRRPSFQFYPADWQTNSNLRRCTRSEKSVWLDLLCLMHDSAEYGVLRWSLKEISEAANCKLSELRGLVTKGVLKGADAGKSCDHFIYTPRSGRTDGAPVTLISEQEGPIWYSSRMVRDEYVRANAGKATRFGAGRGEGRGDTKSDAAMAPHDHGEMNTPPGKFHSPDPSPARRHGEGQGDGSSTSSSSSIPSLREGGADAPPGAGAGFWSEGVAILRSLLGKSDRGARAFLGRLLQVSGDNQPEIMRLLRHAEAQGFADPEGWLMAAAARQGGARLGKAATQREADHDDNQREIERLELEARGEQWPDTFDGHTIEGRAA